MSRRVLLNTPVGLGSSNKIPCHTNQRPTLVCFWKTVFLWAGHRNMLLRVALKLRSLRFHSPQLCRVAVFLMQQTNVSLPSPALQAAFIASFCACCFCTRTGRRHASSRFWTTSKRNQTPLGLLTAALLSSKLKSKTGLMVARAAALRIHINTDGRPLPTKKRWRTSSKACAPQLLTASLYTLLPRTPPPSDLAQGVCTEWCCAIGKWLWLSETPVAMKGCRFKQVGLSNKLLKCSNALCSCSH